MHEWLIVQQGAWVYIALFLALMGGAIGLPIPEDIPLIAAGIIAHRGDASLPVLFGVCYVGIILGDVIIFSVGRKLGSSITQRDWFCNRVSPESLARTKRALEKRSVLTIFIARHLFYLRTVTFLACGAVKMSYSRFLIADCIAALVSASLMMTIGYKFSENMEDILGFLGRTKNTTGLILVGCLIVLLLALRMRRGRQSPKAEPGSEATLPE